MTRCERPLEVSWLGGPAAGPEGLRARILEHLEWMRVTGYSPLTVQIRRSPLRLFAEWCEARGIGRPAEVTTAVLEAYQRSLYHAERSRGGSLSLPGQINRLQAVRVLFRWLARTHRILANPAAELELPRSGRRLPKHVLSAEEVERVLAQPDLATPLGLRDRAVLETLYSTGIRRAEALSLRLYDVDEHRGILTIRQGKGRKDRTVPIGPRALSWIDRYVREARPLHPEEELLFLTADGRRIAPNHLTYLASRYVRQAGIGKSGACHILRHSAATLMLENGADIRHIQEMLGHESLRSTQIYTKVSIRSLKEVHQATHPAGASPPARRRRGSSAPPRT